MSPHRFPLARVLTVATLALGAWMIPVLLRPPSVDAVSTGVSPSCPSTSGAGGAAAVNAADTRGGHGCVVIDDGTNTHTFTYTGSAESWTVPAGVTSITVHLLGAGGGGGRSGSATSGGGGGYVTGVLSVGAGEQFEIIVGEGGRRMCTTDVLPLEPASARHNFAFGGGGMGNGDAAFDCSFASGGGRSAIRRAGTGDDLATAGGGGGGGYSGAGGAGGGLTGGTGGGCGGAGGTQSEGGATCTSEPGVAGIKYGGGWAGFSATSAVQGSEGGGGGGGYYGGGAAGDNGGGGGGSSYLAGLGDAVTLPGSGALAGIGAPVNITPPIVDGTLAVGSTVSATGSTWSPGGVSTFQWQVSTDGVNFTDVDAATAATFRIRASGFLRVAETRSTILGSLTVNSAAVTVPKPPPASTTTTPPTTTLPSTTTLPPTTAAPPPPSSGAPAPTTAPPADTVQPTPEPEQPAVDVNGLGSTSDPDIFDVDDNAPKYLRLVLDLEAGEPAAGQVLVSEAGGLKPGSTVRLEMRSEPLVLGEGPADANGDITFESIIPESVAPGLHRLVLSGITPEGEGVSSTAAFEVDASGTITRAVAASESRSGVPSERAMQRALEAGRPVYDPAANTPTTAALAVASVLLLTAVAAGSRPSKGSSRSGTPSGGSTGPADEPAAERDDNAQGSLESINTGGLDGVDKEVSSWGDRSRTWRFPGREVFQGAAAACSSFFGNKSVLITRLLLDGHWVRAVFGSLQVLPLAAGAVLGVVAGVQVDGVFAPTFALVAALIVLAMVDALAGALGWVAFTVVVVSSHGISGWFDVRTLLGLGVLFVGLPLLANHTRPLRRDAGGRLGHADRFGDYVIAPVVVAFAASSIYTALNGLSGLELVGSSEAISVRWVAGLAVIGRLLIEDLVMRGYPRRLHDSELPQAPGPHTVVRIGTILFRGALFVLASASFLGFGWHLWLVVGLTAVVPMLQLFTDRFPNSAFLNRWFPSGVLRTFLMIFIGVWFASLVLGADTSPENTRRLLSVLLIPGIVLGLVDVFAREGGEWADNLRKRVLGGCLWVYVLAVLVGLVSV